MVNISFLYSLKDINDRAVIVYLYLNDRANKDGICWPGINTIAKDLKRSRSTVKRAIHELRDLDLIQTEQRFRPNGAKSSLEYRLSRPIHY